MRAAVLYEPGSRIVVEDVEIGEPGPGEVLVKVEAAGVCHTDWEVQRGLLPHKMPVILGHEGAGRVAALGDGVAGINLGDKVVCTWNPNCGNCFYCRRDQRFLCERVGAGWRAGGLFGPVSRLSVRGERVNHYSHTSCHAEYCVVPQNGAIVIPEDMPSDRACLLGCAVATGYAGVVRRAEARPAESVAVIGCGAVGLGAVQGARLCGASPIVAVDLLSDRLDLAAQIGATHLVEARADDVVGTVRQLTKGRGVDVAIEAAGSEDAMLQAAQSARPGGRVVLLGKLPPGTDVAWPFDVFMAERQVVRSSYGGAQPAIDFPRLAELYLQGELFLDEMITSRVPLDDINVGFDAVGADIRCVVEL